MKAGAPGAEFSSQVHKIYILLQTDGTGWRLFVAELKRNQQIRAGKLKTTASNTETKTTTLEILVSAPLIIQNQDGSCNNELQFGNCGAFT